MSRTFRGIIDQLSEQTGYDHDFLVDRYNEVMEDDGDFEYFINVTMERDW